MATSRRARLAGGVAAAAAILAATVVSANQAAFADSGNKCTKTAHTSTCINITGVDLRVDDIYVTHHNSHPTSTTGWFELVGPNRLHIWSGVVKYAGGNNAQHTWIVGHKMTAGTYCAQWFVNGSPETGRACATVHA